MTTEEPKEVVPVPPGMVVAFSPSGGLEYLIPTNRILILEARDFPSNHSTGYKQYHILDQEGRRILFAEENERNLIPCCCCCSGRDEINWSIEMYNSQGISIMNGCRTLTSSRSSCKHLNFNCQGSAFGQLIGGILQSSENHCCQYATSIFTIVDGTGTPVFLIGNRHLTVVGNCCCGHSSWNFPLMTLNGDPIGVITTFDGPSDFANSKFGAEFPVDLDVKIKALLIYATIMIDYQYFDQPPKKQH